MIIFCWHTDQDPITLVPVEIFPTQAHNCVLLSSLKILSKADYRAFWRKKMFFHNFALEYCWLRVEKKKKEVTFADWNIQIKGLMSKKEVRTFSNKKILLQSDCVYCVKVVSDIFPKKLCGAVLVIMWSYKTDNLTGTLWNHTYVFWTF